MVVSADRSLQFATHVASTWLKCHPNTAFATFYKYIQKYIQKYVVLVEINNLSTANHNGPSTPNCRLSSDRRALVDVVSIATRGGLRRILG